MQTQEKRDTLGSTTHLSVEPQRDADVEAWDKTDRPLRFPPRRLLDGSSTPEAGSDPARTRWLEENDIDTQFLDAGIGCCWFAQKGDLEPVSGETEDEAIVQVARENGLTLWRNA
jgi:hypothetical protein